MESLKELYSEILESIKNDIDTGCLVVQPQSRHDGSRRIGDSGKFPTEIFDHAKRLLTRTRVCEFSVTAGLLAQGGVVNKCDVVDMVKTACQQLGESKAESLSAQWFSAKTSSDEKVEVDTPDPINIFRIVEFAAAAVVLVIVWILRERRSIRLRRLNRELTRSPDLVAIHELTKDPSEVADVARELVETAMEPWRWRLYDALPIKSPSQHRLFELLFKRGLCKVAEIRPSSGSVFDPSEMSALVDDTSDDKWIVNHVKSCGYRIDDRLAHRAKVDISTIDAWVLLDSRCAIGRFLGDRHNADSLLPGGYGRRFRWRAVWGIIHPEDLREEFDEKSLDTWRSRMISELYSEYDDQRRQLVLTAHVGDIFEPSTMEARGDVPPGDAVVEAVVKRDGVPQHGLACPGGSPLLLAVVIVKRKPAGDV